MDIHWELEHNGIMSRKLILASGSPRRRDLLQEAGVDFEVITSGADELEETSGLAPAELAMENARLKAAAVAVLEPGRCVLGADTVVTLGGRIFGKPPSLAKAREFLRALSGATHEVITGCVLLLADGTLEKFHVVTRVTFRELSLAVIDDYLEKVSVLDKAGAYALQEQGDQLIAKVEGSNSNVIGLPLETLAPLLRKHRLL